MNFDDITKRAVEVRTQYDELNAAEGRPTWNGQNLMSGFVGDVGQLMKITMAKDGLRKMDDIDAKLQHEMADCLWSILVLADKYGVDLSKTFMQSMDELEERIKTKGY